MASENTELIGTLNSTKNKPTVAEIQQWYEQNKKKLENYDAAKNGIKQLRDIAKTTTKSISTFSKEKLRTYLQNIGSNEKNLRNLSWYLYYRSQTYARLVNFNSNMFCLYARSVIPDYDLTQPPDKDTVLKSYNDTIVELDRMNLQQEFLNIYTTNFIQDVFYGVYLSDDTGTFIFPIPADYGKIVGKYMTGDFAYAIDMSYFRSRQELLEYIPDPFQSMYNEYLSTSQKWQVVPDEYAICTKYRVEDYETVLPPFIACFNAFINLSDLEDIQAIANEQQIYKMIWMELETITGSQDVDDWRVDVDLALEYFNRMVNEALPEYTTAAIVPGKLNTITFDSDTSVDVNKVSKATESVLNTAGGSEILNGSTISGAEAFRYAQIANTEYAISSLLPQTQAIVNRLLSYKISNPAKVKFFPVSVYTKKQFKDELLQAAEYGLPTKLAYNSLNTFSEKETMALNYLEEQILNLGSVFVPLQSTHTQSSSTTDSDNTGGRPKSDDVTTDGETSEDKRDKANG